MASEKGWDHGLCDCFGGSWCLSYWCPCILYGKNKYRLTHPEDPDLNGFGGAGDSNCLLWLAVQCFTGCGPLLSMFTRGEIREKLHIKGNGCTDCLSACCCNCCAMVQEERELSNPTNRARLQNRQQVQVAYGAQPQMQYPQQAHPGAPQYQYQQPIQQGHPVQQQQAFYPPKA